MSAQAPREELRLGRYVLKRCLGEGGNGQVFLAWADSALDEPLVCVVKFPLQRYAVNEVHCRRCLNEAKLVVQLGTHPNIVHVSDVGIHQRMPFIVMEFVDGADLAAVLETRRQHHDGLSLPVIYNIFASIATGLYHAHHGATIEGKPVGVVHRDIKPANILITRDGITKIADFGIGVALEDGTSGQHLRGTARYMSPEHLLGKARPQMDIYALGVVAWEMVENREYREGVDGNQHYPSIMDGKIPPLLNRETPKELVSIIESCLAADSELRPTASELLTWLAKCPGYSRDPELVKREITSIIGTRRTSGASQQYLAATPELVATFAALQQSAKNLGDHRVTNVGRSRPSVAEPTAVDGPLPHRSPGAKLGLTLELPLPEIAAQPAVLPPSAVTPAKTPIVAPPWADVAQPVPSDLAAPGRTEPGISARDSNELARAPLPDRGADAPWRRGVLLPLIVGVALSIVATVWVMRMGWFGGPDDDRGLASAAAVEQLGSPVVQGPTLTFAQPPAVSAQPIASPAVAEPQPVASTQPTTTANPEPSPAAAAQPEVTPQEPDQPAAAPPQPTKQPTKKKPKKPAAPRARVPLTLVLFLVPAVELKIGPDKFLVRSKTKVDVPAGRARVKWRLPGEVDWHDAGRQRFAKGRAYLVRLYSAIDPVIIDIQEGSP